MEYIHSHHFIHRDIKPGNFVVGIGSNANQVNVIDFGLAKKYRDIKTRCHISYSENHSLTGTTVFASINNHLGLQQSRRDDLESLAYVLIYFLNGSLPWYDARVATKGQGRRIMMRKKKMYSSSSIVCQTCPSEFGVFLDYTRNLQFDDKPDYMYLRGLFHDLFVRNGYQNDDLFDWSAMVDDD